MVNSKLKEIVPGIFVNPDEIVWIAGYMEGQYNACFIEVAYKVRGWFGSRNVETRKFQATKEWIDKYFLKG